jgi:hypothetical protein
MDAVQEKASAAIGNTKKLPFEEPHRNYMKQVPLWDRYEDVMSGMEDVQTKQKWLTKYPLEVDEFYEHRVKQSEFLGTSEIAIERMAGAVSPSQPQFTSKSAKVVEWMDDVDGIGTSFRDYMEERSEAANVMGIDFVLVTKTGPVLEVPEGTELTKAQEEEAGEVTVALESITAREVVSWGIKNGVPEWVAVRKYVRESSGPLGEMKLMERWRVFEKNTMQAYEREVNDSIEEEELVAVGGVIEHNLGRVPIEPVYGNRKGDFLGKSFISGSSRADLAKFREDSSGQAIRDTHAHPLLTMTSSRDLKDIMKGGMAFRLEPDEAMGYVPLDGTAMDKRAEASERFLREGVRVTGSNPSFTSDEQTFRGESGVAAKHRHTQTEERHITRHTKQLEKAAVGILDLVATIFEDFASPDKIEPDYNTANFVNTFEATDLESMTRNYESTLTMIDSETYDKTMQKKIALRMVADAPLETREQIKKEIDEAEPQDHDEDPNEPPMFGDKQN